MKRDKFPKVYEKCSKLLHTKNPFGSGVDLEYYEKQLPIWVNEIMGLLNSHIIHLLDLDGFYLIHMRCESDNRVKGYTFTPTGDLAEP